MTTLSSGAFPEAAARLREHGSFIFLKLGAHYLDPGVPDHWDRLVEEGVDRDEDVWSAVEDLLLACLPGLEKRVYFPVPMARQRELDASVLRERFSYRMIVVDEDQRWFWNGVEVADRTRLFFTEHLSYESAVDRYYFEYAVKADWIDKSYFEARMTPMLARALRAGDGGVECALNNGASDVLDPGSFRLDDRQRLLARSESHGEVLVERNERFRVLSSVSEDLKSTEFDGLHIPLSYEDEP
ncbi:MAG: hypothetical protein AAGK22_02145 [Acidobacteriota bacterium]